jgi:hypothetical protein
MRLSKGVPASFLAVFLRPLNVIDAKKINGLIGKINDSILAATNGKEANIR